MQLFGKRAWWMPEWLGRILPNLAVEPADTPVDGGPKPAVVTESE
jgi:RND superfamily putative drug exporter